MEDSIDVQAVRWLEDAAVGRVGHSSANSAFGLNAIDPLWGRAPSRAIEHRIRRLAKRARWPPLVEAVYMAVGSAEREFIKDEWTFMAVDRIEERLALYALHGQARVCDLAVQYQGMGHFNVLCVDRHTGRMFVREDGGSNGWDVDRNWQFAKNLDVGELDDSHFQVWDPKLPPFTNPVVAK